MIRALVLASAIWCTVTACATTAAAPRPDDDTTPAVATAEATGKTTGKAAAPVAADLDGPLTGQSPKDGSPGHVLGVDAAASNAEARPSSPRAGRDRGAAAALRARLDALPRCAPGATVGELTLSTTVCTRMACPERCCNACGWLATFISRSGVEPPLAPLHLGALLGFPEGALECEVAAWNEVLRGRDVGLEGAGCVVR